MRVYHALCTVTSVICASGPDVPIRVLNKTSERELCDFSWFSRDPASVRKTVCSASSSPPLGRFIIVTAATNHPQHPTLGIIGFFLSCAYTRKHTWVKKLFIMFWILTENQAILCIVISLAYSRRNVKIVIFPADYRTKKVKSLRFEILVGERNSRVVDSSPKTVRRWCKRPSQTQYGAENLSSVS